MWKNIRKVLLVKTSIGGGHWLNFQLTVQK